MEEIQLFRTVGLKNEGTELDYIHTYIYIYIYYNLHKKTCIHGIGTQGLGTICTIPGKIAPHIYSVIYTIYAYNKHTVGLYLLVYK